MHYFMDQMANCDRVRYKQEICLLHQNYHVDCTNVTIFQNIATEDWVLLEQPTFLIKLMNNYGKLMAARGEMETHSKTSQLHIIQQC